MTGQERRRYPRTGISRPIKLKCMTTGKYLIGRTQNVSAGGALVVVDRPSLLVGGQRLEAGIAWNSDQAVIGSGDMVRTTVVRSLGLGRMQHVALQFDQAMAMGATAASG